MPAKRTGLLACLLLFQVAAAGADEELGHPGRLAEARATETPPGSGAASVSPATPWLPGRTLDALGRNGVVRATFGIEGMHHADRVLAGR
jgi:hypothetical protein